MSEIKLTNIADATMKPQRKIHLYTVTDKFGWDDHVFLKLKGLNYRCFVTIAFEHFNNEAMASSVEIGDKIEYTNKIGATNGMHCQKRFFEDERIATMVSEIKVWKPNVVSLTGYRKLQQPQTRFKPRLF